MGFFEQRSTLVMDLRRVLTFRCLLESDLVDFHGLSRSQEGVLLGFRRASW
uniref:Uncharacterized protein n=1 Tax=Cucumis melo TaxID=3656 RepID=A0A9I9DK57_CUCME